MPRVSITFDSDDWDMVIQALDFARRAEGRANELVKALLGDAAGFAYTARAEHFAYLETAVRQQVTAAAPPRPRL